MLHSQGIATGPVWLKLKRAGYRGKELALLVLDDPFLFSFCSSTLQVPYPFPLVHCTIRPGCFYVEYLNVLYVGKFAECVGFLYIFPYCDCHI